jgi:hypothetical protein
LKQRLDALAAQEGRSSGGRFTVAPHFQIINYRDGFSPIDRI